jgi:DNA-binding sugar fermentation-stimulating protein
MRFGQELIPATLIRRYKRFLAYRAEVGPEEIELAERVEVDLTPAAG